LALAITFKSSSNNITGKEKIKTKIQSFNDKETVPKIFSKNPI